MSWSRNFVVTVVGYYALVSIVLHFLVSIHTRIVWLFDFALITYLGGGYFFYVIYRSHRTDRKKKIELSTMIFVIIVGLIATIPPIVDFEYVPIRYLGFSQDFDTMSVIVDYESPLVIPMKNFHNPIETKMNLTIYNLKEGFKIDSVRLSSPLNSIITVPNQKFMKLSNQTEKLVYGNKISVEHGSEIFNTTENYVVDITFLNSQNHSGIYHNKVSFPWNIQSLDFDIRTYYWIVIEGVLASRFIDFLLRRLKVVDQIKINIGKEALKLANETDPKKVEEINTNINRLIENKNRVRDKIVQDLDWKELLWIIFSFIISLLVFSSFKQSVTLTSSVIVNISLAFGFGFTFDRTLELATRFKPIFVTDTEE